MNQLQVSSKLVFPFLIFSFLLVGQLRASTVDADTLNADQLYGKADTLLLFSRTDSSIFYFNKARTAYKRQENWEGLIKTLNKLAENKIEQFKLLEARNLTDDALHLAGQYLSENHPARVNGWINQGNIYYLTGQHENALAEYSKVLERGVRSDQIYSAPTNMGLGNVYYSQQQYQKAFIHFKRALKANEELLGSFHPYVGNSYLSLANLYRNQGNNVLAEKEYKRALEIYQLIFGEAHPDVASAYVGLAEVHITSGKYDVAEDYFTQALIIYSKFLDDRNPKFGAIYMGQADLALNRGNVQEAIEGYNRALDLYLTTLGKTHQETVRAYMGLANAYNYLQDYKNALKYYNEVLEVNFYLVGEKHANTSAAYNNLGALYYYGGRFETALDYLKRGLAIDKELYGKDHPDIVNGNYNIARLQGELDSTLIALEYIDAAIAASLFDLEQMSGVQEPVILHYFDLRDLLNALEYKSQLIKQLQSGIDAQTFDSIPKRMVEVDYLLSKLSESLTDRNNWLTFGNYALTCYDQLIEAAYLMTLRAPRFGRSKAPYVQLYHDFLTKKRTIENRYVLARSQPPRFREVAEAVVQDEIALTKRLNENAQQLSAYPDSLRSQELVGSFNKANANFNDLQNALRSQYSDFFALKHGAYPVNVKELQSELSDSTGVITYHIGKDSLYVSFLTATDIQLTRTYLEWDYEDRINEFRRSIVQQAGPIYTQLAHEWYERLFPFELDEKLASLFIVVDGSLAKIPFEALLTDAVETSPLDYGSLPYLVLNQNICYVQSLNGTAEWVEEVRTPIASGEIWAVDTLSIDLVKGMEAVRNRFYDMWQVPYEERNSVQLTAKLSRPNGSQEVKAVGFSSDAWKNDETESVFLFTEKRATNYTYLATSAIMNGSEPEFSAFFLKAAGESDGIVTLTELYGASLNSALVLLTNASVTDAPGNASLGLMNGMDYAGIDQMAISLWSNPAAERGNFFEKFYTKNVKVAAPLHVVMSEVKRQMIRDSSSNHPRLWSGYVLMKK